MANALIRDPSAWINGLPIAQSELSALDLALAQPVNGEGGGTYTQAAGATTIAGAGVWLAASTAHTLANSALALTPSDKAVTHADNDYTTLALSHLGGFREVITACARAGTVGGWTYAPSSRVSLVSTRVGAEMVLPLRVLDGARLGYAELHFFVSTGHAMTPRSPVRFRLLRIDAAGVATPLATNADDGFVPFTEDVGTGGSFNASTMRTLTIFCDNPTIVDAAKYSYVAHVFEEAGQYAVAGNIFADVKCSHYDIHDLRPQ